MGNRDLPDIYARALGPAALGLGHIYQANPSCPCYNLYIYIYTRITKNYEFKKGVGIDSTIKSTETRILLA